MCLNSDSGYCGRGYGQALTSRRKQRDHLGGCCNTLAKSAGGRSEAERRRQVLDVF